MARRPIREGDGDERHGSYNGYAYHGCRCAGCRAANVENQKKYKTGGYRRNLCACGSEKAAISEKCRACEVAAREAPHGTEARYARCRCAACREAARIGRAARRKATA